jgi:hypothetical protein
MKKSKKGLKVFVIIVVVLVALVYGGVFLGHKVIFKEDFSTIPTIEAVTDGTMTFGVQAHPAQPDTVEDFIPVLAQQLRSYNEIAPELWYNNAIVNQTLFIEKIRGNKFWKIAPDGTATPLSKKEFKGYMGDYGFSRMSYVDGFNAFDGGMYLAIADVDVKNVLKWQKYLHLGTYDAAITFTHENFHGAEQEKWQFIGDVPNSEREEFLEDTAARAKRELLQKQLLRAVSEPGNTQLILDVLATYEDWKVQFPEDYKNAVYFDCIEGTAFYFELISSLYIGYPDQIKSRDDVDRAIALLATREDVYVDYGLVKEGYNVGGFACVLLDRLDDSWQERLVSTPNATPMEMLAEHFKGETLPEPRQITQAEIDAVGEKIQNLPGTPAGLFRFLYDVLF